VAGLYVGWFRVESPCFNLTISNDERKMLIFCMGAIVPGIRHETIKLLDPDRFLSLADKLFSLVPVENAAELKRPAITEAPAGGMAHARAVLLPPAAATAPTQPPIEQRDRWARDRKGIERPNPKGCESAERFISKLESRPLDDGSPRMIVGWEAPTGNGFVQGNCFDDKLFPWLIMRQKTGEKTILHVVRSGKYLNVVGVRA
jgi:hypothetical protein